MASKLATNKGEFGKVRIETDRYGIKIAVKIKPKSSDSARNELEILKLLDSGNINRHIVKFLGYSKSEGNINIRTEAAEGSMVDFVKHTSFSFFNKDQMTLPGLHQLLDGLHFLHSEKKILHRDNILVFSYNETYQLKFSGFGISKRMNDPKSISYVGTILYMAPELFDLDNECTKSSDIWSLGATMMFWINIGQHYFCGTTFPNSIAKIRSWQGFCENENERYSRTHPTSFDKISRMFMANPYSRAGTSDLVKNSSKSF